MGRSFRSFALSALAALQFAAPAGGSQVFRVPYADKSPVIDGIVEPEWEHALTFSKFHRLANDEGDPAGKPLEARLLSDGETLYFLLYNGNRPTARTGLMDRNSPSDYFTIILGTAGDIENNMETVRQQFRVEASGNMIDGMNGNEAWNLPRHIAVSRSDSSWTAELALPMRYLIHQGSDDQIWAIEVLSWVNRTYEGRTEHAAAFARSYNEVGFDNEQHGLIQVPLTVPTRSYKIIATPSLSSTEGLGVPHLEILHDSGKGRVALTMFPSFLAAGFPQGFIGHSVYEVQQGETRDLFQGIEQPPGLQLLYTQRLDDVRMAVKANQDHGQNALTLVDALTDEDMNIFYAYDSFRLSYESKIGIAVAHRGQPQEGSSGAGEAFANIRRGKWFILNGNYALAFPAMGNSDHEFMIETGLDNKVGSRLLIGYQEVGKQFDINPTGILQTVDRRRYRVSAAAAGNDLFGIPRVAIEGTYLEADLHDGRSAGDLYRGSISYTLDAGVNGGLCFDRWGDRVTLPDGADLLYWADALSAYVSTNPGRLLSFNGSWAYRHEYDFEDRFPIRVISAQGTVTLRSQRNKIWLSGTSNSEYNQHEFHEQRDQMEVGGESIVAPNLSVGGAGEYNSVDGRTQGNLVVRFVPDPDEGLTAGLRFQEGSRTEAFLTVSKRIK